MSEEPKKEWATPEVKTYRPENVKITTPDGHEVTGFRDGESITHTSRKYKGPIATEPTIIDSQQKHADRLLMLNQMAAVINELKPMSCMGLLKLVPGGTIDQGANDYILSCRRRCPDMGIAVYLTRDFSRSLHDNIHLGNFIHLSLEPLDEEFMKSFKLRYPHFRQVNELDDTSAQDWVTNAFAPHHLHAWEERLANGTRNFRLFTDREFSGPKKLWANQSRELREVLGWRSVREEWA